MPVLIAHKIMHNNDSDDEICTVGAEDIHTGHEGAPETKVLYNPHISCGYNTGYFS